MQADITRVRREHYELDRSAVKLQQTIATGPESCDEAFANLAGFASVISEHLLGEHDVLEAAQQGRDLSSQFGRMRSDLQALRWDWEEYLSVWTPDTARHDWNTFSEHSLTMLDRIRRRIQHENELLNAASPK